MLVSSRLIALSIALSLGMLVAVVLGRPLVGIGLEAAAGAAFLAGMCRRFYVEEPPQ